MNKLVGNKRIRNKHHRRIGGLLIEAILSLAIMAAISAVFAGTIKTSIGLLRNQELGNEHQIADMTVDWVVGRARGADQVRVVGGSTLELTYNSIPAVSERIFVRSRQLIVERGGIPEVVAEPIDSINFTDPDGRGSLIRVGLTGGSMDGINGPKTVFQSFAPDWLKQ